MSAAQIIGVYAVIGLVLFLVRLLAHTLVDRIAFSWMGPIPAIGELWSTYQWRWATYSLDWLIQITVLFGCLNALFMLYPETQQYQLLFAFQFALALGLGMALLACVGFLIRCAKARFLGPNPAFAPPPEMETGIDA
jgi:hypothetical protein